MDQNKAKRNEAKQKISTLKVKTAQLVYGYEDYITEKEREILHRHRCELADMLDKWNKKAVD